MSPSTASHALQALNAADAPASPAARAYRQQLARVDKLRSQLADLEALDQAHRAERQALAAPLMARRVQAHKQLVHALAEVLQGQWLGAGLRARARTCLCDTAQALAEDGHTDMVALHDAHSPVSLAQKRQARADQLRAQIEAALGAPLDGLDGASPDAVLRAGFQRLQGAQQDERDARRQKRDRKREARRQRADPLAPGLQDDADTLLRRLFRQLASALHPDREPDPQARQHKTALMAEANAAYARRDLVTLMQVQQRAAADAAAPAAALPDDRLAALTLLLRQQVVALERERAARQQTLAHTADLPDGVSANANTLRQARIDELRQLERAVADAEHALAQTRDAAALKRWLNARATVQDRDQVG